MEQTIRRGVDLEMDHNSHHLPITTVLDTGAQTRPNPRRNWKSREGPLLEVGLEVEAEEGAINRLLSCVIGFNSWLFSNAAVAKAVCFSSRLLPSAHPGSLKQPQCQRNCGRGDLSRVFEAGSH